MPYYNSGMLLINVEGLRKEYSKTEVFRFVKRMLPGWHIRIRMYGICFFNRIQWLEEMKYNCLVSAHSYKDEKRILSESVILHFAGGWKQRPTYYGFREHFNCAINGEVWWKYARKCGYWKEFIWWKIINTIWVKPWQSCYRVYKFLGISEKGWR